MEKKLLRILVFFLFISAIILGIAPKATSWDGNPIIMIDNIEGRKTTNGLFLVLGLLTNNSTQANNVKSIRASNSNSSIDPNTYTNWFRFNEIRKNDTSYQFIIETPFTGQYGSYKIEVTYQDNSTETLTTPSINQWTNPYPPTSGLEVIYPQNSNTPTFRFMPIADSNVDYYLVRVRYFESPLQARMIYRTTKITQWVPNQPIEVDFLENSDGQGTEEQLVFGREYEVRVEAYDENGASSPQTWQASFRSQKRVYFWLPYELELYDDFSSPFIDKNKWKWAEWVREIDTGSGKLLFKHGSDNPNTASSFPHITRNNLSFSDANSVNSIQADVTILENQVSGAASARARLEGYWYNYGTGDIWTELSLSSGQTGLFARWVVSKFENNVETVLGLGNFTTPIILGTTYTLYIEYNSVSNQLTFRVGGEQITFGPTGLPARVGNANSTFNSLTTRVQIDNQNSSGYIVATFDNVYKNGILYDDFSSPTIDSAKWTRYEFVREISGGKLRSKTRTSLASTSSIYNRLEFVNPSVINVIQAKVTPITYQNDQGANIVARIGGCYYNDGSLGGGRIGDVSAQVRIGGTGVNPIAEWTVWRHLDYAGNVPEDIAIGAFTTPITLGNAYTLFLGWDGSRFTFKIDDEIAHYTPTTTINPSNIPWKELTTRIWNPANKEATIEAIFDDVMAGILSRGAISGRVTDPIGNPLVNVNVGVIDPNNLWVAGGMTDGNGNYTIPVAPGSYKVQFNPMNVGPYILEWYSNTDNRDFATLVNVLAGQTTTGINAQLKEIKRVQLFDLAIYNGNLPGAFIPYPGFRGLVQGATLTGPNGFFHNYNLQTETLNWLSECRYLVGWQKNFGPMTEDKYGLYTLQVTYVDGYVETLTRNLQPSAQPAVRVDKNTIGVMVNPDGSASVSWALPVGSSQWYEVRVRSQDGATEYYRSSSMLLEQSANNPSGSLNIPASALRCLEKGKTYRWLVRAYDEPNYAIWGVSLYTTVETSDPPVYVSYDFDPSLQRTSMTTSMFWVDNLGLGFDVRPGSRSEVTQASVSGPNAFSYQFDVVGNFYDLSTDARFNKVWWKEFRPQDLPSSPINTYAGNYTFEIQFSDNHTETLNRTLSDMPVTAVDTNSMSSTIYPNGWMSFQWGLPQGVTGQDYVLRIRSLDGRKEFYGSPDWRDRSTATLSFWDLRSLEPAKTYRWFVRSYDPADNRMRQSSQMFFYNPFNLPYHTLSVAKSGTGAGTIISPAPGINCGSYCSDTYVSGVSVTLTATPNLGSVFTGWSGACSGTGPCTVTMSSNTSVTANFNLLFVDSDNDGLDDAWEMLYFGTLNYGANDDPDGDGLKNIVEYQLGSNPNNPDTDNDGTSDWDEYKGHISGRVTDPNGNPLGNVNIGVLDPNNLWVVGAMTDGNGNYTIPVAPGSYKVQFNPMNVGPYIFEWYSNTDNRDFATLVNVLAGQTTTGINAQLKVIKRIQIFDLAIYNGNLTGGIVPYPGFRGLVQGATLTGPNGFSHNFNLQTETLNWLSECRYLVGWQKNFGLMTSDRYGLYTLQVTYVDGYVETLTRNLQPSAHPAVRVEQNTIGVTVNSDGSARVNWTLPVGSSQWYEVRVRSDNGATEYYRSSPLYLQYSSGSPTASLDILASALRCLEKGKTYRWLVRAFDEPNYAIWGVSLYTTVETSDPPVYVSYDFDPSVQRTSMYTSMFWVDNLAFGFDVRPGSRSEVTQASVTGPNNLSYQFDVVNNFYDLSTDVRVNKAWWREFRPQDLPSPPINNYAGNYTFQIQFSDNHTETLNRTLSDVPVTAVDPGSMVSTIYPNGWMSFLWGLPQGVTGQDYVIRIRNLDGRKEYYGSPDWRDRSGATVSFGELRSLEPAKTYRWFVRSYDPLDNRMRQSSQTFFYNPFNLPYHTLSVTKPGTGAGMVTSPTPGINCGAYCSDTYVSGVTVTLTATPASGSIFTGWSGACSGTGPCTVTMSSDVSVSAGFLNAAMDSDGDGIPDGWEWTHFKTLTYGASDDPDSDGLTNLFEYQKGTDPNDPDTDDDGISDRVDTQPDGISNDFSDGVTYGSIIDRGDQLLIITDEPTPDGVRIKADPSGGPSPATISVCGSATFSLNAGNEVTVKCGSVEIKVLQGTVHITFIATDGTTAETSLVEGNSLVFEPVTITFTVPHDNPETVIVTIEDKEISFEPGEEVMVINIDIKPGSFPNSINLGSMGTVPVAILSSPYFDATKVDPRTVTLASAPVKLKGKGTPMASFEDVNGDGRLDLVVHVDTTALQLREGDVKAILDGKTLEGRIIRGVDSVRIVRKRK